MFDVKKIRQDFPMITNHPDIVYFDSAATSLKPWQVIEEIKDYYCFQTSNVHRGDYQLSHQVSEKFENARATMAEFIGAKNVDEVIFTSGASSSLNMVAFGYALQHLKKGDVILTTEAEHASNLLPWFKVMEKTGAIVRYIPLAEDGTFSISNFESVIDERVKIVAVAAVTNVLGYRISIKELSAITHRYGAILVVDGAQSVPHCKIDVSYEDVDFLAFSSHKMCGPSGVGILYGKMALLEKMEPTYFGGGMNARFDNCGNVLLKKIPTRFESGTPNIEGVLGMAAAAKYLMTLSMSEIETYTQKLSEYFFENASKIPHLIIHNVGADTGILTFSVKDIFSQDVASYLNSQGIAVRSGTHCAKILHNILGTSDTVRASLYFYNTTEEIDRLLIALQEITLEKCLEVFC